MKRRKRKNKIRRKIKGKRGIKRNIREGNLK